MNEREQIHPDREKLVAFGLGQLAEETAAAMEAHLASCPECAQVLEGLKGDSFIIRLQAAALPATADNPVPARSTAGPEAPTLTVTVTPKPATDLVVPPELANHPRYRVGRVLGMGGMGVVYQATHLLMDRLVALKVIARSLTQDLTAVERFHREVRAAARLSHPNIVTAFDAEQAGDLHFLVMEYVEGTSLQHVLSALGPLSVTQASDYARQVALGLQHAYERGMVHRDIKPGNLLLTPEGRIKILDFGLTRFARESAPSGSVAVAPPGGPDSAALTQFGCLMGTPDYIAPEQIRDPHAADIRADLYSLGCTLYCLLAGQGPFAKAGGLEKLMAHSEGSPRPLTVFRHDVPPGLVRVMERMMAKDPAQRYQTPVDAAAALEPYTVAGSTRPETPEITKEMTAAGSQRWKAVLSRAVFAVPVVWFLILIPSQPNETLGPAMENLYLVCAVLGGTVLGFQFLMGLAGLGHHHDIGEGHDFHDAVGHDGGGHADGGHDDHAAAHERSASRFARNLTLRTLVAGLTFFGLAGGAASASELPPAASFVLALGAGASAFYGVAWLMRALQRLRAEGTARIEGAVGLTGTVYLTIPGARAGAGKVHLNMQNRTVEYQAVTAAGSLPTGTRITVVAVVSPGTVEVVPANTSTRVSHV
jgi:anti-sigma factor RsiW